MGRGYVKLHREAMDHEVFQDEWLWKLFCWCMMKANFKPATFRGQRIGRGSFATGRLAAAEELNVAPSRVYRGLTRLAEMGCISVKPNSNWTTVTVCNYSTYNSGEDKSEQQVSASADSKRTASERLNGQPANTIEETKKPRNQSFIQAKTERTNEVLEWQGVRDRLAALHISNFQQTILEAKACGCTEDHALLILEYAVAKSKTPGEVVWRFKRSNPQLPVEKGWPENGMDAEKQVARANAAAERKRREDSQANATALIKTCRRRGIVTDDAIKVELAKAGLEWPA